MQKSRFCGLIGSDMVWSGYKDFRQVKKSGSPQDLRSFETGCNTVHYFSAVSFSFGYVWACSYLNSWPSRLESLGLLVLNLFLWGVEYYLVRFSSYAKFVWASISRWCVHFSTYGVGDRCFVSPLARKLVMLLHEGRVWRRSGCLISVAPFRCFFWPD